MAVSTRDLMMVLRARDEASKVLKGLEGNIKHMSQASKDAAAKHQEQGKALIGLGVGIAAASAVGVKWLVDSTKAAQEYNQQVALTSTQTDKVNVSFQQLSDIGLDLAKTIPVPFEQIQTGLYDVFSSMDVSVPDAKKLLTEFSKAAVAGQTDLQTASRGTIAILNAWHMPASNVNKVNDIMFKLVQKGVGTYDQFASSIGRAIPSTVRAGGSIQDLAGMMAFMTRNGLSTAQAATSAGRAFDAMSNPETEKHMKEIGISVRDAKGEFLPMVDVIRQMHEKLGKMTAPDRAKAMKALFLGSGGTIQARRFFDLAVPGFTDLNKLTGEMQNSSGSLQEAYDTMFKQPQSQVELLNNKYKAMKVEVGNELLPIKMKLVDAGMKLLDMWNNLSPGMQKTIVIIAAVTAVIGLLVGIILVVVGGILLFMGAAAAAGVALSTIGIIVVAVIAGIVALSAVVVLIIKHWKDVKDATVKAWNAIWSWLKAQFDRIVNGAKTFGSTISNFFSARWKAIKDNTTRWWGDIVAYIKAVPGRIMAALSNVGPNLSRWISAAWKGVISGTKTGITNMMTHVKGVKDKIVGAFANAGSWLIHAGEAIIKGLITGIGNMVGSLKNKLGSVTNMIPNWKGPADKDLQLLQPNGKLIIQGFQKGIDLQTPELQKQLGALTTSIPSMTGSQPPVVSGSGGPRTAPMDGSGTNFYQTFNIETQEIDPMKHAADLGWEITKVVG